MIKRKLFYLLIVIVATLVDACGPEPPNIKANKVLPTTSMHTRDDVILLNCDGGLEYSSTLYAEKPSRKTLKIDSIATNDDGSEYKIPATLGLQLEIEVENTYQQEYENINKRLETITLNATPGKKTIYIVQWEKWRYHSKVAFSHKGDVYRVFYTYEVLFPSPKRIYKKESICPNLTPSPTATSTATATIKTPSPSATATNESGPTSPSSTRTKPPKDTKTPISIPTTYP